MRGIAEKQEIPYYHLDILEEPEIASYFEVLTVPAVMVYHCGQEALRQARFIGHKQINELLEKLPQDDEPVDYDQLFN
ncbi:thioredoxin family protein [Enterococcus sp. AZ109]|uniref:thioredoxin family protein n=1 Tax=Enterococcus sp. AZ109 TaxID=2774634 RepID=UPI003F231EDD